jgi:hypothetical protein
MKWTGKTTWLLVNLLGGIAVIGSYIVGFQSRADATTILWGGVPASFRPFYTAGMLLAALGYFAFGIFLLRMDAGAARVFKRYGFGIFSVLFLVILIPSALWLPLSFWAVDRASQVLVWLVRLDLALVGAGSLGLLLALLNTRPAVPAWLYRIALLGSALFCLQTVVLDALVWSVLFRV